MTFLTILGLLFGMAGVIFAVFLISDDGGVSMSSGEAVGVLIRYLLYAVIPSITLMATTQLFDALFKNQPFWLKMLFPIALIAIVLILAFLSIPLGLPAPAWIMIGLGFLFYWSIFQSQHAVVRFIRKPRGIPKTFMI